MAWQQGGDLYGQVVNSAGAAQGGDRPLVTHEGNQQEAALATGHSAGYGLLAWRDNRSGNDDIYSRLITPPLQTTRISYSYDPLYRLRTAIYTGAITATYHYVYDGVGNMTAYTEQVDNQTTAVSRSFNAANQLVSSNDGSETVDYAYDANGNLVTIDHWLMSVQTTYAYDQRNLLTSQTNWRIGEPDLQAAFVYDGDGYRVQMIDYTGLPLATTYSNDILGLTQVLLADDGATTTANLLGLDLIAQDNGSETRVLLADGLGSARVEMVGGVVETTTTYEPYGKLLAQSGSSGTTYGFTGEQEDAATGLVYLRSRYYSPYLNQFESRDPFSGYVKLPVSQNGYSYAHNNSINYTDPSGHCAEYGDDTCWSVYDRIYAYVHQHPERFLSSNISVWNDPEWWIELGGRDEENLLAIHSQLSTEYTWGQPDPLLHGAHMPADFVTLQLGYSYGAVSFTRDQYGNLYGAYGISVGPEDLAFYPIEVDFTAGEIVAEQVPAKDAFGLEWQLYCGEPTPAELEAILSGSSAGLSGGFGAGGDISATLSPDPSTASIQIGFYSPQAGGELVIHAAKVYDARTRTWSFSSLWPPLWWPR